VSLGFHPKDMKRKEKLNKKKNDFTVNITNSKSSGMSQMPAVKQYRA
jgi:hypothetical protein